jgi:hypothetical protein
MLVRELRRSFVHTAIVTWGSPQNQGKYRRPQGRFEAKVFVAPVLIILLATTQSIPDRIEADARDAGQQIVVAFRKVGGTFKAMGQDVGEGTKETGLAIGHAAKGGGLAVGHGAKEAGKSVGEGAATFGKKVKKRAKKIGQGAKEAVN